MESPLGFDLNCPKCGKRLEYIFKDCAAHILLCYDDGVVVLPPSGRVFVASGYEKNSDLPKLPRHRLGV